MDIHRNVPFHKLSSGAKLKVAMTILEHAGINLHEQMFQVKIAYLDDLSDADLDDVLKTYLEINDFEKCAYIRDFIKKRKEKNDAGTEQN